MAGAVEILVINLDRSPERMAFMARQLEDLDLDFIRLPATDGANIDDAEFERLANTYMRPITRSELACLCSHARAWQHCADRDRPVLVLEDDAFLSARLPDFLADFPTLKTHDIVNVETQGTTKWISKTPAVSAQASGVVLFELYIDRGGSVGYIVLPNAARALLERAKHYAAPSDAFLNLSGIPRHQVEPGLVSTLFDGGEAGRLFKAPFRSTIKLPKKASRRALIALRPRMKLRRLAGYFAMSLRKLATIGRGIKRTVAVCPTILVRAKQMERLTNG